MYSLNKTESAKHHYFVCSSVSIYHFIPLFFHYYCIICLCSFFSTPNGKLTSAVTSLPNGKGFSFLAQAGMNYGSTYGVFINDAPASDVEKYCYFGLDNGPKIEDTVVPDRNPAVTFDCR